MALGDFSINTNLFANMLGTRARHHRCTRATSVSGKPNTPASLPPELTVLRRSLESARSDLAPLRSLNVDDVGALSRLVFMWLEL